MAVYSPSRYFSGCAAYLRAGIMLFHHRLNIGVREADRATLKPREGPARRFLKPPEIFRLPMGIFDDRRPRHNGIAAAHDGRSSDHFQARFCRHEVAHVAVLLIYAGKFLLSGGLIKLMGKTHQCCSPRSASVVCWLYARGAFVAGTHSRRAVSSHLLRLTSLTRTDATA